MNEVERKTRGVLEALFSFHISSPGFRLIQISNPRKLLLFSFSFMNTFILRSAFLILPSWLFDFPLAPHYSAQVKVSGSKEIQTQHLQSQDLQRGWTDAWFRFLTETRNWNSGGDSTSGLPQVIYLKFTSNLFQPQTRSEHRKSADLRIFGDKRLLSAARLNFSRQPLFSSQRNLHLILSSSVS